MVARIRSLFVAVAVLAGSLLFAPPAYAAFAYDCSDSDNLHAYIHHLDTSHINYVWGTIASVRPLEACRTNSGDSLVMTTNLQGYAFVQLGYGVLSTIDALDWVYTPSDVSGGVIIHPTGAHTKPVLGHAYKQAINRNATVWYYRTTDTTLNTLPFDTNGSTNSRTYGLESWEGFEIHDRNSQFGGPGVAIYLGNSAYRYVGSSTTHYIDNAGIQTCCGVHWSWQHYGVVNVSGSHTQVWAYTDNH
ncbi:MAG: hypothetical protein QOF11_1700 [Chloroflexota bacterium]|jgi:hypothetical protein|nr:hypothetical protein [Chloroflexota bacterium]